MTNYKAGCHLYEEVCSQDRAWSDVIPVVLGERRALRDLFRGAEQVAFTGCGSSLNTCLALAPVFQSLTGIHAVAVPAADTYFYPKAFLPARGRTVAVLLSRSGKTTEIVNSLSSFRRQKTPTLGVTCSAGSPLAADSELALVLPSLLEQAVATTRSLTGMMLALQLVSAMVARNDPFLDELQKLPGLFAAHREEFRWLGEAIGRDEGLRRYAFVGNGPFYGCAREAQLKFKELTLLPSDAYPLFDFRHGPQSNVGPGMLLTVLLSDAAREQEGRFLRDMGSLGGALWVIGEKVDGDLGGALGRVLDLRSGLSELARLPLTLPAVQFAAYYRALSLGLDPDAPPNLSYWIRLPA
jgi:glucosamine--fructose-6-phosphate aminotransferase (isomerizing)